MADNKIRMPSSMAGITTYSEEYKSRFMLTPQHVLIFIAIVTCFVIALNVLN